MSSPPEPTSPGNVPVPSQPSENPPQALPRAMMQLMGHPETLHENRRYLNMPDPDFREPPIHIDAKRAQVFDQFVLSLVLVTHATSSQTLEVDVLIPKTVIRGTVQDDKVPVHVRFHGGGFCTGAPLYKPWFAYHVRDLCLETECITLMPRYRKMPEASGADILADVSVFWYWFLSSSFTTSLQAQFSAAGAPSFDVSTRIQKEKLLVSGDSAGGFLSVYSWLSEPELRISALYLQYPMLGTYTRDAGHPYMGKYISEEELRVFAADRLPRILKLREEGRLGHRTASEPPEGMDMAYVLACAKVDGERRNWWGVFFGEGDVLGRVGWLVERESEGGNPAVVSGPGISTENTASITKGPHPKPAYCPAIFITHGKRDINCAYTDTLLFKSLVEQLYPDANIHVELREEEAHAFDYNLEMEEKENRWLFGVYFGVMKAWLGEEGKGREV